MLYYSSFSNREENSADQCSCNNRNPETPDQEEVCVAFKGNLGSGVYDTPQTYTDPYFPRLHIVYGVILGRGSRGSISCHKLNLGFHDLPPVIANSTIVYDWPAIITKTKKGILKTRMPFCIRTRAG